MAPTRTPLASLLFFTSGATALAYQVIWFKRFSHFWGNSSLAMAGVVAGFLLGLGIGARLLSGLADRARSPLFVYGLFEVAIAGLSLAVPLQLGLLLEWTSSLQVALEGRTLPLAVLRLSAAALAIGPPTILMGATLPLLVREFAREGGVGRATSWFYAINTAGAAFGCYATGFHLLPTLGLRATHVGAALLNLLVALVAIAVGLAARRSSPPAAQGDAAEQVEGPGLHLSPGLRAAAFATGFGALVLQMVWARQLAMTLGGTTYAFTAVVLVVLVGIGLGSFLLRLLLERVEDTRLLMVGTTVVLVAGTLLGQALLPTLSVAVGERIVERASPLYNALLCVGASVALELLPSLAAGVLFPLLVHLTRAEAAAAGRAVGRVYAWNTAGTTFGATLPTLLLLPAIGSKGSVLVALLAYLLAPLLFFGRGLLARRSLVLLLLGAAISVPLVQASYDHYTTRLGMFLYGPDIVEEVAGAEVLLHEEGPVCDVLVLGYDGIVNLRVNGKIDASTHPNDQVTQLGTAYLPLFLRPEAEDVLVIGYGSGASVGGSLLFPGTQQVTCLEIEPAVYEASRYFGGINHAPEDSPRFEVLIDDGRSHLMSTERVYDMILTEPSNPWMAGVANLFTLEFYEAARKRLAPGGILSQWMQTYAMSEEEYSLVVRTILEVFPECVVLMLSEGDTILLASDSPLVPDPATLDLAQAAVDSVPALQQDLVRYFEQSSVRGLLLARLLMGTSQLEPWARSFGDSIHTDWNMTLEFEAPLRLFERLPLEERLSRKLLAATGEDWVRQLQVQLGATGDPARAGASAAGLALGYRHLASQYQSLGRKDRALEAIEIALQAYPDEGSLEGDRLYYVVEGEPPPGWDGEVRRLMESSAPVVNRLAVQFGRDGRYDLTVRVLEPLLEAFPDSVTLWVNKAVALEQMGELEEARGAVRRALELDPRDGEALELAGRLGA